MDSSKVSFFFSPNSYRGEDDPALWAGDVGNSWRTTNDIEDTWARLEFLLFCPLSVLYHTAMPYLLMEFPSMQHDNNCRP